MKHTKGKWIAKDNIYSTLKRTEIWSDQDNEEPIFEILHKEVNLSECTPNANLISKAPEMYGALKEIYKDAVYKYGNGLLPKHIKDIHSLLKQIES